MTDILEKINELNSLVLMGKPLEAFDKFYHEEVSTQENEEPPIEGKALNRSKEEKFMSELVEFRFAKPLKITLGKDVSMVEWQYDFTHQSLGRRSYTQISIQEWKDGLIISEKYYYDTKNFEG